MENFGRFLQSKKVNIPNRQTDSGESSKKVAAIFNRIALSISVFLSSSLSDIEENVKRYLICYDTN
jgi:hypothetical protein